ncbi:hypothetical protein AB0K66_04520 [Streptomyces werraensis]|uniref:hypothetical protein n=1 Tax=Streptomyces werraensis TaxID=68284 RepID=UPI003438BA5C
MTTRRTINDITSDELDALYDRLNQMRDVIARVRETCEQLHRACVLADGHPRTDRERGVLQAVTRVSAALTATEATGPCTQHPQAPTIGGHCGGCTIYPADMRPARPGIRGLLEHVGIATTGRDITVAGHVVDPAEPPRRSED